MVEKGLGAGIAQEDHITDRGICIFGEWRGTPLQCACFFTSPSVCQTYKAARDDNNCLKGVYKKIS